MLLCAWRGNLSMAVDPEQHSVNADEEMSYRPRLRKVSEYEQGTPMRDGVPVAILFDGQQEEL